MKELFCIILIFFVVSNLLCQSDTIQKESSYSDTSFYKNGQIKILSNLKDNGRRVIKEGHYMKLTEEGEIIEEGNYNGNRKIGRWTECNGYGCQSGNYKNGKKDGSWQWKSGIDGQTHYYKNGKHLKKKTVFIRYAE